MDFTEMFNLQEDWQNKARTALAATTAAAAVPNIPSANKQKRIDEITNQIAALSEQKVAMALRIDVAIVACTDQLTRLQAELPQDKKLIQDVANAIGNSPKDAGTAAPPKQVDAAQLPRASSEGTTPAKKASTRTPPKRTKTKTGTKK